MHKLIDPNCDIVISGISGRYPTSDDVNEFWKNLVEGNDMVSSQDEFTLYATSTLNDINTLKICQLIRKP
ncbi:unnamed protein product [Allacma fusca]|uniref:Beta-ketoacyl synthase-like N-terminal domain-containing protein n=1 Tax=Allacma fusca TaxID=39272 RepID=A0A8J2JH61_9HEXA|nr:unnamed protein product [Allacma fusca]